jgi:ABC-type glycerol-3-phosphate transport system substrate-binding protein
MVHSVRQEVISHMTRLAALVVVLVLALAACGGSSSAGSATPDPALAFCPALDTYGKSLTKLDAMTATSSVDDYKAAAADAKTAFEGVKAVAGPFAGAQLDTAQTAQVQLEAAVAGLPANATPADAEAALQDPLQNLIGQIALTYNAICNTHPTPSAS